jgi:hypothetical protein
VGHDKFGLSSSDVSAFVKAFNTALCSMSSRPSSVQGRELSNFDSRKTRRILEARANPVKQLRG